MTEGWDIRPATPGDIADLTLIAKAAFAPYIPVIGRAPAPMTADFAAHLDRDLVWVIAAPKDAKIAGYAVICTKLDGAWLESIAVDPAFAGQGIGARLISAIEDDLRAKTDRYSLYTNALMTNNIAWYQRLGFRQTEMRSEDGFDRVYFEKSL